jgi:hypothetical protein
MMDVVCVNSSLYKIFEKKSKSLILVRVNHAYLNDYTGVQNCAHQYQF